jgi:hypothetical protein
MAAVAAHAPFLVTYDRDLLDLAKPFGVHERRKGQTIVRFVSAPLARPNPGSPEGPIHVFLPF